MKDTLSFPFLLERDADEWEVTARVRRTWTLDPAYGADADGRRSNPALFLDDLELLSVSSPAGEHLLVSDEERTSILAAAETHDPPEEDPYDDYDG